MLELEQTSEACEELKFTVVVLERTVNRAELIQERCSSMRKHMLCVKRFQVHGYLKNGVYFKLMAFSSG